MISILNAPTAAVVAQKLLEIKAIKLSPDQPFTWSSGWKSPIYCDNRIALSYPDTRSLIKEALIKGIRQHFPEVELIAGVATAGIAQGALVADGLALPFAYVRPKAKDHGMGNQIEGRVNPGQKVVVLEDLVSTGGSSLKAVDALREAGVDVIGMVAIFTYGFDVARQAFAEHKVPLLVLSDYAHLIQLARQQGIVSKEQETFLNTWREDPASWGQ
jgi:orotate phosphoribosyltransferase